MSDTRRCGFILNCMQISECPTTHTAMLPLQQKQRPVACFCGQQHQAELGNTSQKLHPLLGQFDHLATRLSPSCNSSAPSNHKQISVGLLALAEAQRRGCNNGWTYHSNCPRHHVLFICIVEICIMAWKQKRVMKRRVGTNFGLFPSMWLAVDCANLSSSFNTGDVWKAERLFLVYHLPNFSVSF